MKAIAILLVHGLVSYSDGEHMLTDTRAKGLLVVGAVALVGIAVVAAARVDRFAAMAPRGHCERGFTPVASTPAPPQRDSEAEDVQGAVLPGQELRSQIVAGEPVPTLDADKPDEYVFHEQSDWIGLEGIPRTRRVYATEADAVFNDDDAAYRISFHYSHYGGMPIDAGDFNGDGISDFMVTDHFAWVDGGNRAGEVHLYFGKQNEMIDPTTQVPDILFYGEEPYGKLGITIAGDGDFNGDGLSDLALGAAYTTTIREDGTEVPNAGKVYVIFGGTLDLSTRPVKVRMGDVGRQIPGVVFEGGHDDSRQLAYANGIEFGDFNNDGADDLLIGSYNPYDYNDDGGPLDWPARAWLVYGSHSDPVAGRAFRLGRDTCRGPFSTHEITVPERGWTRVSLGWSTNFIGDVNGDGYEDIGFGTHAGGTHQNGAVYIFLGGPEALPAGGTTPVTSADSVIVADKEWHGSGESQLQSGSLLGARPAGDVNGDGLPDVLIASRTARLRSSDESDGFNVGAVGILLGAPEFRSEINFFDLGHILHGVEPGTLAQPAMDIGSDLDGDDYADIIVNDAYFPDWLDEQTVQPRGRFWIVRGGPDLPKYVGVHDSADLTILADTRVPGLFGYTWTTGDWNNDGRADIVIGDHYAGDRLGNVHAGKVYMFYNGSGFNLRRLSPIDQSSRVQD